MNLMLEDYLLSRCILLFRGEIEDKGVEEVVSCYLDACVNATCGAAASNGSGPAKADAPRLADQLARRSRTEHCPRSITCRLQTDSPCDHGLQKM